MNIAGLSPAGTLTVRSGEPFAMHVGLANAAGDLQSLAGKTFKLVFRLTTEPTPVALPGDRDGIDTELDAEGLRAIALGTAADADAIYAAGENRSLSYDIVETTGGASISKWTGRVTVAPGPALPTDIIPAYADLPANVALLEPMTIVVVQAGATGKDAEWRLFAAGYITAPTVEKMDERYYSAGAAGAAPFAEAAGASADEAAEMARQSAISRLAAADDANRADAAANSLTGPIYDDEATGLAANPVDGTEWRAFTPDHATYDVGYFKTVIGTAVLRGGSVGADAVERVLSVVQSGPTQGIPDEIVATKANALGFVLEDTYANGGTAGIAGEFNAPGHDERAAVVNALGFVHHESGDDGVGVPGCTFQASPRAAIEVANMLGFVYQEVAADGLGTGYATLGGVTSESLYSIANRLGFVLFEIGFDGLISSEDSEPVEPEVPFDPAPLLGGRLCFAPDEPLTLYTAQIFGTAIKPGEALVTVATDGPRGVRVYSSSGLIDLDPAWIGNEIEITARAIGSGSAKRTTLTVSKGDGSGSPLVALIGDSITNRQTAMFVNDDLDAWGYTPTFIGTMNGSISDSSNGNAGGLLGEGREGYALSDYLYTDLDGEAAPLAPGGEAAYLASSKAAKLLVNPFIRASTGGDDPSVIHNGYVFDYGFYLSRFSLATPEIILVGLGMNDVIEETAEQARSQIITLGSQMLQSIRAAAPAAKIGIWFPPISRLSTNDGRIAADEGIDVVRAWLEVIATLADANIELINAHALVTIETGDLATGSPLVASDIVHPIGFKRRQLASVLAAFIAARTI